MFAALEDERDSGGVAVCNDPGSGRLDLTRKLHRGDGGPGAARAARL